MYLNNKHGSANSKYAFLGSNWPSEDVSLHNKQQTVSVKPASNILLKLLYTIYVTPYYKGFIVKITVILGNPQVTKAFNWLVGTSETIRLLSIINFVLLILYFNIFFKFFINYTFIVVPSLRLKGVRTYKKISQPSNPGSNNPQFKEWLAGLIDGDGYFSMTKKGYTSLEITADIRDEHALNIIKNVYGGTIKLVTGKRALRYCLRHKEGFLALINDVNGLIRSSSRLMQLNKILDKYGLELKYPEKLTYFNGWLSGFFDADGSITLNKSNGQLAINLSQKTNELLLPLVELYGGSVYIDRTNNTFKWHISSKEGILNILKYFKKNTPKSMKKNRLYLIARGYELKSLGAHKAKDNNLNKAWNYFLEKWEKYEV